MNRKDSMTPILTPEDIRRGIQYWTDHENQFIISKKAKGAITGALVDAVKLSGITNPADLTWCRRLVIGYLTIPLHKPLKPRSSKDLSDNEWMGFSRWQSEKIDPSTSDSKYRQRPTFPDEVAQVLYRARHDNLIAQGQLPLFGMLKRWEYTPQDDEEFKVNDFYHYIRDNLPESVNKLQDIFIQGETT